MNDWEQTFLRKLEEGKRLWQGRFERFAQECIQPAFTSLQSFTAAHGFSAAAPETENGIRRYKFGLTENGYLLMSFRLHGFEEIEVDQEIVVPGADSTSTSTKRSRLDDANDDWVEQQFQAGLSRFVSQFVEASESSANHEAELATA